MFSQELVQAIARLNVPAEFGLGDLAACCGHPVQTQARCLRESTRRDHSIAIQLEYEVSKLRLATLRDSYGSQRPKPLDHSDLESIAADKYGLVDLSEFDQDGGGLAIGGSVFEILPALSARNSSYWTLHALNSLSDRVSPRIRLDPLMCSERKGYRAMFYRMFVFGQPLTWLKILSLSREVTQRWMPDNPDEADVVFTDCVWTPRDDEVHLRCEECPKPTATAFRPSRYFHAVIDRDAESIVHCDGALRLFSFDEAEERSEMHIRDAGKIGIRLKLFQIDGELDSECWLTLLKAFFIWNRDIEKFAAELTAG